MICDNCVWNYANEVYDFCERRKKAQVNYCPRFQQVDEEWLVEHGLKNTNNMVCPVCKRNKDPGKCWWCGN
jgi:hypothetical protein